MSEIKDLENTLILETTKGRVVIELFADLAPRHVAQIRRLTKVGA
ncbi:peptidylprolyl isomerase, partial [Bartonella sp. MR168JLCBS]